MPSNCQKSTLQHELSPQCRTLWDPPICAVMGGLGGLGGLVGLVVGELAQFGSPITSGVGYSVTMNSMIMPCW